jgi:hypothetical protein
MKIFRKYVGVVICLLVLKSVGAMTPPEDKRQDHLAKITTEIFNAYRFSSTPPVVKIAEFTASNYDVVIAKYVGYGNSFTDAKDTIYIQDATYQLCRKFGKDSLNALAYVIGHEIGHYFQKHDHESEFGNHDIRSAAWSFEDTKRAEAEADFFAGFFGHLAGYNTIGVSSSLLRSFYEDWNLSANKHPSLTERIAISDSVNKRLKHLLVVFDAGLFFTASQHYSKAAHCFEYLANDLVFPSREMYTNLGVALYYQAMSIEVKVGKPEYIMPLIMDNESRLYSEKYDDGQDVLPMVGNPSAAREKLFIQSIEAFKKANELDSSYWISRYNLGYVLLANGKTVESQEVFVETFLRKECRLDPLYESRMAHYEAILLAGNGKDKKVDKLFKKSLKDCREAEWNYCVFKKEVDPLEAYKVLAPLENPETSIGDISLDKILWVLEEATNLKAFSNDFLLTVDCKNPNWSALQYKVEADRFNLVMVNAASKLESNRKIRIGSLTAELLLNYGEPTRVSKMRSTEYYYYAKQRVIFEVKDEIIQRWVVLN